MILATHAIAGAAVGRLTNNPLLAFIFGVISHFILDAIPHWQYKLNSKIESEDIMAEDMPLNKKFVGDIAKIGVDFFGGVFISLLAFHGWSGFASPPTLLIAGIAGGVLPDALQFVFWKFKREPFTTIHKFHFWIHAGWDFNHDSMLGMALQIITAATIIFISRIISPLI